MPRESEQVALNKKARFEYEILERVEAGLILTGGEVKSLRDHKVSFADAYARVEEGEIFLVNLDIAAYDHAGYAQHDPKRKRKLLLHAREVKKLASKVAERGLTLVPLGIHFNSRGWAKVRLGLCRGKQQFDKRRKVKDREQKRDMEREMKRRR